MAAILVENEQFIGTFSTLVDRSEQSLCCAYYISSIPTMGPASTLLRKMYNALARASYRSVDVRFILGWPTNFQNQMKNLVTARYLAERGIDTRIAPELHAKFSVFDSNFSLVGSHNLNTGGLTENLETSLLIRSRNTADALKMAYELIWQKATLYSDWKWPQDT